MKHYDTFKVVGLYKATSRKTGKDFAGMYTLCADRDPKNGYLAEHFFIPPVVYNILITFPLGVCVRIFFDRRGRIENVEVQEEVWDLSF